MKFRSLAPILLLVLQTACSTISNPYLYSIEREGKQKAIILGTIHTGVPIKELPSVVFEKMKAAKYVYFEIDLEHFEKKQNDPVTIYEYMIENGEPTLEERLGPELWAAFLQNFPKLDPKRLNEFRPSFGLSLLNTLDKSSVRVTNYEYIAMQRENRMDYRLEKFAKENGANVLALEDDPCRKELDAAATMEIAQRLKGHHETARVSMDKFRDLTDAYRDANDAVLQDLVFNEHGKNPELLKCIFHTRNHAWAKQLRDFLRNGTSNIFIAVGAGHLLPSKITPSLLELLEQQGFTVRRIKE